MVKKIWTRKRPLNVKGKVLHYRLTDPKYLFQDAALTTPVTAVDQIVRGVKAILGPNLNTGSGQFKGTGGGILFGATNSLYSTGNSGFASSAFTWMGVIKVATIPGSGNRNVFRCGADTRAMTFRHTVNTNYLFQANVASSNYVQSGARIQAGEWFLVTVTYDGAGNGAFYINGHADATKVAAALVGPDNGRVCVGGMWDANGMDGSIAEAVLFNRVLSQVERIAAEKELVRLHIDKIEYRPLYVSTLPGIGNSANQGYFKGKPYESTFRAGSRLGSNGLNSEGTIRLQSSATYPDKGNTAAGGGIDFNYDKRIRVLAWDNGPTYFSANTIDANTGWQQVNGDVWRFYCGSVITGVSVARSLWFTGIPGEAAGLFWRPRWPGNNVAEKTTNPPEGQFGYFFMDLPNYETVPDTGVLGWLYVHFPAGTGDPNGKGGVISGAPSCVQIATPAGVLIDQPIAMGGYNAVIRVGVTNRLGTAWIVGGDLRYGFVGVGTGSAICNVVCLRTKGRAIFNDIFNVHGPAGTLVVLVRVDAKYADDEPASPHDQTTMRVRGGEFCFGGSGGITGVGSARMEIDGAYFEGNNRFNPDPDTGGVSFQCGKTPEGVPTPMSGYVRNITFGDGNNGGTNLFIDDFSKQLVTLDRAASMIVKSGPP